MMTTSEIFSHGAWQFVGLVVTFAIAYLTYFTQQRYKEIAVGIYVHSMSSTTQKPEWAADCPCAITIGFVHSGNDPIRRDDFDQPITIHLGVEASISVLRTFAKPRSIQLHAKNLGNKIEISPLLLNSGDEIVVEIAGEKICAPCLIDARIAGVPELRNVAKPVDSPGAAKSTLFLNSLMSLAFLTMIELRTEGTPLARFQGLAMVIFAVLAVSYVIYDYLHRQRRGRRHVTRIANIENVLTKDHGTISTTSRLIRVVAGIFLALVTLGLCMLLNASTVTTFGDVIGVVIYVALILLSGIGALANFRTAFAGQ